MGRCMFWIGVPPPLRRRPPPRRHVPLAHPTAGRDARRSAPFAARPDPEDSPSWAGSRRRRCLDHGGLADSEGSPGPAPGRGPPGRPNKGRVGGARKVESETRSKRKAGANAVFLSEISVASSCLHEGSRSGCGLVLSLLTLLSGGPTPDECEVTRRPSTSASAHLGRKCGVSTPIRLTGPESVPLSWSRPGGVNLG